MKNVLKSPYTKLALLGLLSRSFTLLLGYVSQRIFGRFDPSTSFEKTDSIFKFLLSWDAIHFLHIADHGYTHEHSLPFFPLLPYLVRSLPFGNNLAKAVFFNNICFIISSFIFYKISIQRYAPHTSMLASIFFLLNPASIIYSSFYSESLFSLLFFMAYFYLLKGRTARAVSFLALCSLCRSNAILFLLFVGSLWFVPIILPFALFQLYSLLLICRNDCHFRFFVPYSYIQKRYWNQGFLKFYTLNNIPNILYGIGFVLYPLYVIYEFTISRIYLVFKKKLEMNEKDFDRLSIINKLSIAYKYMFNDCFMNHKFVQLISDPFFSNKTDLITKLVIILGIQTVMLILFIHMNGAARFISYNPFLYWSFAVMSQRMFHSLLFRIFAGFFIAYSILYTVFFSCFYPPA